jgi:raffinose/stachyose/melibiose transport system substrate-binding protein
MKKMIIMLAAIFVFSALLFAGGGQETGDGTDKKVTLKLCTHYTAGGSSPNVDYAISKVKEKYPNIEFEIEPFPQDGGQILKTRAATGNLPDIIWLNSGLIEPLSKSSSIIQLDDYVTKSGFADQISAAAREYCLKSSDGHIYMFSVEAVQPILWYYNKDLFDQNNIKVPENFDELISAITAFKAKNIIPMALFGKEPWPLGAFFEAFAMKENPGGVRPLEQGQARLSSPAYTKAVTKMKRAIDAGVFQQGVTNADYDTAFAFFRAGRAAMFQNGSWNINDMKDLDYTINYFTHYPTNDAGSVVNNNAFAGGGDTVGYGVSATAKNIELAAEAARILALAQAEYDYTYKGSVGSSADTEKITPKNPLPQMGQRLASQMSTIVFESTMLQNFPNAEFATGFAEEMQKILVGGSAADFISNVDRLIEKTTR